MVDLETPGIGGKSALAQDDCFVQFRAPPQWADQEGQTASLPWLPQRGRSKVISIAFRAQTVHNPRRPECALRIGNLETAISPSSPSFHAELAARGRRATYRKSTILINEGEITDGVYLILSGRVKVFSMDADAREIVFGMLGPGDYFGEMSLDGGPRSASIITEDVTVCAIVTRAQVREYMAEDPAFAHELLDTVIRRAREATRIARELALDDAYARLVAFLERESSQQSDGTRSLAGRLTQQDIARRIGCGREMVGRAIKRLEDEGYIERRDGLIVILRRLPRRQ